MFMNESLTGSFEHEDEEYGAIRFDVSIECVSNEEEIEKSGSDVDLSLALSLSDDTVIEKFEEQRGALSGSFIFNVMEIAYKVEWSVSLD